MIINVLKLALKEHSLTLIMYVNHVPLIVDVVSMKKLALYVETHTDLIH